MSLADDSMKQLKMKKMILLQLIGDVEKEAEEKGLAVEEFDSRIDEPKRQLRLIKDEIKRREGDMPPDLVVGLNTLKLDMKTKKS